MSYEYLTSKLQATWMLAFLFSCRVSNLAQLQFPSTTNNHFSETIFLLKIKKYNVQYTIYIAREFFSCEILMIIGDVTN